MALSAEFRVVDRKRAGRKRVDEDRQCQYLKQSVLRSTKAYRQA